VQRAVFLDRDGTIIEDAGYIGEISGIKFLPMVGEAIKLLNESGFKVIITTNQAGVARGYFTEEAVREVNRYIEETLAQQGALIDRTYYCPHHTEGVVKEYRKECHWRKPNPGMIEAAAREFGIDLKDSFVIGDKLSDIEAGYRVECRTVLLTNQEAPEGGGETALTPDYIAADLYEAVKWLVSAANQG
jgi:D-glycero-D-manno-heptose 1,7-bisphosphate phosphatase